MSSSKKDKDIIPLGDRVVVKRTSEESAVTVSGIIIPDTVDKAKPEQGKVIAVGSGRVNDNGDTIAMSVKVGDTILFSKYGPDEVEVEGENYLIISESNILAIIK